LKVTSKTHQEEMCHQIKSKPVQLIDCNKLQESASIDESINKSVNKSAKTPIKERIKYMPKYVCILI